MTDEEKVAAYLRATLWPDKPGFTYSDAMRAEIEAKCSAMAADILTLLKPAQADLEA